MGRCKVVLSTHSGAHWCWHGVYIYMALKMYSTCITTRISYMKSLLNSKGPKMFLTILTLGTTLEGDSKESKHWQNAPSVSISKLNFTEIMTYVVIFMPLQQYFSHILKLPKSNWIQMENSHERDWNLTARVVYKRYYFKTNLQWNIILTMTNELPYNKTNKVAWVPPSKDSDQPGHPPAPSRIKVFAVRFLGS